MPHLPHLSETNYLCVAAIAIQLECLDYQFLATIVDYAAWPAIGSIATPKELKT